MYDPCMEWAVERFWRKVRKVRGGCWIWEGSTDRGGYGHIRVGGKEYTVHRFSHLIHHGYLPLNLHIRIRCKNRRCVNPEHLYVGVPDGYMVDVEGGVGEVVRATHCRNGHLYDEENTRYRAARGARDCRACRREYQSRYMKQRRSAAKKLKEAA